MKFILLLCTLFITGCSVSKSSHYNIEVKIGSDIAEKQEIANKIGKIIWSGDLRAIITEQIPELPEIPLEKMFGIKWHTMHFKNNEGQESQTVFIQCLVRHSDAKVIDKVLELCRNRVEYELENYDA
jgi:hypothetical protein